MKKIYYIICCALFCSYEIQSIDAFELLKEEANCSERVSIEKKISKEESRKVQQERKKIAESHQSLAKRLTKEESSSPTPKSPDCLYAPAYSKPLYIVKGIGASGKTLTFENETIWELSNSSAATARTWNPGAYVIIIPNTSWFSSYTYRLENVLDGSSVSANLSEGPFVKYATFISFVDPMTHSVALTDNTVWTISNDSRSSRILRSWQQGQAVLIGESRGWFGWPNGNILININENDYIAVHPAL